MLLWTVLLWTVQGCATRDTIVQQERKRILPAKPVTVTTIRASKVLPHWLVDGGRSVMKSIVVVSNGYAFGFAGIGISGGTVG